MWIGWLASALAAWPDLPGAGTPRDGTADIALIVAVSDYYQLKDVPGAEDNARAWGAWFHDRGTTVVSLLGPDATREKVLAKAEALVPAAQGTAWFVFVGHGTSPVEAGATDGRLVMVDADASAIGIGANSVARKEVLAAVARARPRSVAVLDACFSGALVDGMPVHPVSERVGRGTIVLTAATAEQVAGALPGEDRPAFSYLVLGSLARGWADADQSATTTAAEVRALAASVLLTVPSRQQTPTLEGDGALVLARPRPEPLPDPSPERAVARTAPRRAQASGRPLAIAGAAGVLAGGIGMAVAGSGWVACRTGDAVDCRSEVWRAFPVSAGVGAAGVGLVVSGLAVGGVW